MAILKDTAQEQAELQKQLEQQKKDLMFFEGLSKADQAKKAQVASQNSGLSSKDISAENAMVKFDTTPEKREELLNLQNAFNNPNPGVSAEAMKKVNPELARFKGTNFLDIETQVKKREKAIQEYEQRLAKLQGPQPEQIMFEQAQKQAQQPIVNEIEKLKARNEQISAKGFASTTETNEVLANKQLIEDLEKQKADALAKVGDFASFQPNQSVAISSPSYQNQVSRTKDILTQSIEALKGKENLTNAEKFKLETSEKKLQSLMETQKRAATAQQQRIKYQDAIEGLEEGSEARKKATAELEEFEKQNQALMDGRKALEESKFTAINNIQRQAEQKKRSDIRARITRLSGSGLARAELERLATEEVNAAVDEDLKIAIEDIEANYEQGIEDLMTKEEALDLSFEDVVESFKETKELTPGEILKRTQDQAKLTLMNDYITQGYDTATALRMAERDYTDLGDQGVIDYNNAKAFLSAPNTASLSLGEQYSQLQTVFGLDGEQSYTMFKKFYGSSDLANKAQEEYFKSQGIGSGNVDAILAQDVDDSRKFEAYYNSVGSDVQAAFEGIKTRVGEAKARAMKQDFLKSKGWTEEDVVLDDFTDDLQSIYNGEVMGMFEVPALVTKMKKAGMPETFINAQLKTIAESENSNALAVSMANSLMTQTAPKADIRGGVKEGFVQLVTNPDGTVEVKRLSGGGSSNVAYNTSMNLTPRPPKEGYTSLTEEYVDLSAEDPEAAKIVESIINSRTGADLADIPNSKDSGFLKKRVLNLLSIKQQELIADGSFQGVLKASAGGSPLSATERQSFTKAVTVLSSLQALTSKLDKTVSDPNTGEKIDISPLTGWLKKKNPWDTEAQEIEALLTSMIPNLARGVYGEVGVLTNQDVDLYKTTIPNLSQTSDVKKAVTALTLRTVRNSIKNQLEVAASSGVNVSGFVDIYDRLNEQINTLEQSIGVGRSEQILEPEQEPQQIDIIKDPDYNRFLTYTSKDKRAIEALDVLRPDQIEDYFLNGYKQNVSVEKYNFID